MKIFRMMVAMVMVSALVGCGSSTPDTSKVTMEDAEVEHQNLQEAIMAQDYLDVTSLMEATTMIAEVLPPKPRSYDITLLVMQPGSQGTEWVEPQTLKFTYDMDADAELDKMFREQWWADSIAMLAAKDEHLSEIYEAMGGDMLYVLGTIISWHSTDAYDDSHPLEEGYDPKYWAVDSDGDFAWDNVMRSPQGDGKVVFGENAGQVVYEGALARDLDNVHWDEETTLRTFEEQFNLGSN